MDYPPQLAQVAATMIAAGYTPALAYDARGVAFCGVISLVEEGGAKDIACVDMELLSASTEPLAMMSEEIEAVREGLRQRLANAKE